MPTFFKKNNFFLAIIIDKNKKKEYLLIMEIAKEIDEIMFQMEEQGLIPLIKGQFNIVDEIRVHFGEEKFLDFLKDTVKLWGINIVEE